VRRRVVVTDLDNTLYDWVTYFATSFSAMAEDLQELTGVSRDQLFAEFKQVHQRYANSEPPFAALELPSIQRYFGTKDRTTLAQLLDPALHKFNRKRRESLRLYETVRDTMQQLTDRGCIIIGHTEAMLLNAYWRLCFFSLTNYFRRLYTLEGKWEPHPAPEARRLSDPPHDFVRV
jgi:FMN phosphatase YigB (HAD superfamily)